MSVDILFLNLTRFGDLLQSQALLEDCRRAGLRAGLVCLDNFAAALPLLRSPAGSLAPAGARSSSGDWTARAPAGAGMTPPALLLDFVARVRQEAAPRHVANLTATLPARLLASPAGPHPGGGSPASLWIAKGFGFCRGNWAAYLCGTTLKRCNAPFQYAGHVPHGRPTRRATVRQRPRRRGSDTRRPPAAAFG